LGILYLAANQQGLIKVSYVSNKSQFLAELNPLAQLTRDGGDIHAYRQQIEEYFQGRRRSFSLPLDLSGLTDFQKAVLTAIDEIPAGQTRSYGDIADVIERPGAARAVGQALGSNPIPIVLPCHRVVASDGSLGGYTGGLQRKRHLLKLEGALS
jgi:O-6-methylguanine DNA methyltransferase